MDTMGYSVMEKPETAEKTRGYVEKETRKRVSRFGLTLCVFWRKCMGIEPTWEGISPPHWI